MNTKEAAKRVKKFLKDFWYLLWKDDSLKGWVFSFIFLFIFIKFILFPSLSMISGTELPLAIVESCSMYHKGNVFSNFDNWWDRHESKYEPFIINKLDFERYPMPNGFSKGDILILGKANPEKIKLGDIIIFDAGKKNPIIHRVINIQTDAEGKKIFSTIGDNNNGQLSVEKEISEDKLVARTVLRIVPYLGWGKLIFYEPFRPEAEQGLCYEN